MEGATKNEDFIIRGADISADLHPKGCGPFYFEKLTANASLIAQIEAETGRSETYGELLHRSILVAKELQIRGLESKDRICICSTYNFDVIVPFLAGFLLGAPVASLDPTLSSQDTTNLLNVIKPKVVFVSQEAEDLIENSLHLSGLNSVIITFNKIGRHIRFNEFVQVVDQENFAPYEVGNLQETALIVFTSGTNGSPKSVCYSHHAFLGKLATKQTWDNPLLILSYGSLFWMLQIMAVNFSLAFGWTRLITSQFSPAKLWEYIDTYNVDVLVLSPYHLTEVYLSGKPEHVHAKSLQLVIHGGGATHLNVLVGMRNLLPHVAFNSYYGTTESVGPITSFDLQNPMHLKFIVEKPTSIGMAWQTYTMKVVDPDTEIILGPNQEGELRVKSMYLMSGFYNIYSSNYWDSEGYLKTGDIVYYDEDHCFFFVDRIANLIKFRGNTFSLSYVENILLSHPTVRRGIVIGVPNQLVGFQLMAFVQLIENANTTAEEIRAFVDEHVEIRMRLHAGIVVTESFPMTPSYKIDRRSLYKIIFNDNEENDPLSVRHLSLS